MKRFMMTALAVAILPLSASVLAENNPATHATPPTATAPSAPTATQPTKPTTTSAEVTPAERTKIENVVHEYLVNKPEVIVEAFQILQKRQYEEAEKKVQRTQQDSTKYAQQLFHKANDPMAGNPNGKVTIVEFFDYQCPHCVDMAPAIEAVIKSNPDVRYIFKEFPIRGPMSIYAARAALAANMQGKYYPMSRALLTANAPLTQDSILQIAKNIGLNLDQFKKDLSSKTVDDQIKENMKLAQDLNLFGTPAFFIGKTEIGTTAYKGTGSITYTPGQMDQGQMQEMIKKAGA